MHISFLKKKIVEWICGNGIAEIGGKKNLQLICGNAITEIGEGGKLWQCHCRKWEEKKSGMSTIFLQHFHNKSQVISYY